MQQAHNLALTLDEPFKDIKSLIHDRGSNFTASFDAVFQAAGARRQYPPSGVNIAGDSGAWR